jgi:hypothetical protein
MLSTLEDVVYDIPLLAGKSVFHPVKTRLDSFFCPSLLRTHAAIFIISIRENKISATPE